MNLTQKGYAVALPLYLERTDLDPEFSGTGHVRIGSAATIRSTWRRSRFHAGPSGSIRVGDRCYFECVNINSEIGIEIGDDCKIGDGAIIFDTSSHEVDEGAGIWSEPVHLGRNVWLAPRVIVLAGVTIGDHSVVGAGSVVTKSIPERVLAAGNPCRVIRTIHASEAWRRT